MLSIGAMQKGQQNYYLQLAREDYYLNGGEPPGLWRGTGAGDLGLSGVVEGRALTLLLEGAHPQDGHPLTQVQGGKRRHRPGWDLTFSAPKSVSVLWSMADDAARPALQEIHFAAVKAGLGYLEDEIAVTRTGKAGRNREPAGIVAATFEHHTSRAQDPQLHTHALVINVCTDADGRTRTLESPSLYRSKMAAGAVYRAELSALLEREFGLSCVRRGSVFEVAGVSESVMREFSKRRAQIEKALAEVGYSSAAASAVATLNTRRVKGHAALSDLLGHWQETGAMLGWGTEHAAELLSGARAPKRNVFLETAAACNKAAERAVERENYFSARDFTRYLAEEAQGRGIDAGQVREARDAYFAHSADIVRLGRYQGELAYTTRETMAEENALFEALMRGKDGEFAGVSRQTIEGVIATRRRFDPEQAEALRHIAEAGGNVRTVSGMIGKSKGELLHAARLAWELEGFEVHGAAPGGNMAKGLSRETGIAADTLKNVLRDIGRGRLRLHEKSILVIDEAGMISTRMIRQAVEAAVGAGARLVLAGDVKRLPVVEAEGEQRTASAFSTEIERGRDGRVKEASAAFTSGSAEHGLRAYAERGLLSVESDRAKAMEALISAWKETGVRGPEDSLILAGTRREATVLNRMAQEERKRAGQIHGEGISIPDTDERLYIGDRLLFAKKSRVYGVENGSKGKVIAIDTAKQILTVRLDEGDPARFSLTDYAHVRPAYAVTAHEGQGAAAERAFILAGGSMRERDIARVAASRAGGETRVFSDVQEAGEALARQVRQTDRTRQKETARAADDRREPQPTYSADLDM